MILLSWLPDWIPGTKVQIHAYMYMWICELLVTPYNGGLTYIYSACKITNAHVIYTYICTYWKIMSRKEFIISCPDNILFCAATTKALDGVY